MRGKDILYITAAGLGLYTAYRIFRFGESARDAVGKIWSGITFNASDIPKVKLTPSLKLSQRDMIARGYLRIDNNGRFFITPSGDAFIARQKALLK